MNLEKNFEKNTQNSVAESDLSEKNDLNVRNRYSCT